MHWNTRKRCRMTSATSCQRYNIILMAELGKGTTIKRIIGMITDGGIILVSYILILVVALSFYAPTGYYMLGEHKALCFLTVSTVFFVLLLPAVISHIVSYIKSKKGHGIPVYDLSLFIALTAMTLSLMLSSDRLMSLWGIDGWRMGYVTYIFVFYAYMACRLIRIRKYLSLIASFSEIISALVFTLGTLNRIGIYPFASMISTDTSFLSTIGNINWYSAYIAVFLSVGICDIAFFIPSGKELKGVSHILRTITAWACILTGFFTLISMGGTVSTVIVFVTFMTLVSALFMQHIKSDTFTRLCSAFLLILELYGLILSKPASTYTYSTDAVWLKPALSHAGLIACVILLIVYVLSKRIDRNKSYRIPALGIWLMIPLAAIVWLTIVFMYAYPVILDDTFANSRGLIYRISGLYLRQLSPVHILFGIGPDSYFVYAINHKVLSSLLYNTFGDIRLTNAHCLPLSSLINNGIIYTICMTAFFVMVLTVFVKTVFFAKRNGSVSESVIKSTYMDTKRTAFAYAGLLIISSVLFVQFFTFATITATPYLYIAVGICLSENLINRGNYTE